jgi:aldehyde:ferredoxin oxidoreductase
MPYGWQGKVLGVDLSGASMTVMDTARYTPAFLGGKGAAIRIAWEMLPGDIGPYDGGNILVFMTGPLTGTLAPASGRGIICSVSPRVYPKPWYTRSNVGGYWAPELKYAGFDGLIVTGRSGNPVYLLVEDGKASIRGAEELWGLGSFAVQNRLKSAHGAGAQVLTIGPAGENLVRFSTIHHNLSSASGQAGFGAVMGYKRLKAVVIKGSGGVKIADPSRFFDACRDATEKVRNGPNIFHMLSGRDSPDDKIVCSAACPCNCEATAKKDVPARFGSGTLTMLDHCMYPGLGWERTEYSRPEAPEYRTAGVPGLEGYLDVLCIIEDLGLGLWEYFNLYPWFEVFRRNGITSVGGVPLEIDKAGFWCDFFRMTAYREGVGDIFAEGVLRASERLDEIGVPEKHREEIRRIARFEQPAYGFPAHRTGRAAESQPSPLWIFSMLHWAFDTRDPMSSHHQSSFLEYIFTPHHGVVEPSAYVPLEKIKKTYEALFGNGSIVEPGFEPMEAKVRYAIWHQHRSCVKDSLLLCDWVFPRTFSSFVSQDEIDRADHLAGDVDLEAKLFSPATGIEMSSADLELCGERIFNLERALHIRNYGRNRNTDESIEWICELPEKSDGTKLDKKLFDRIVDVYYACRGWRGADGRPTEDTLRRLGLDDVAGVLYGK